MRRNRLSRMCSRFFRAAFGWDAYAAQTGVTPLRGVSPPPADWNAAPGTHHPIIRQRDRTSMREVAPSYWGLVPSWWTKPIQERKFSGIFVNAHDAADRPVYRGAFRYRHCLIPVSGYYLWSGSDRARTPFAVGPKNPQDMICLAGLWDRALIDGSVIESFTLLTTTPNDALAGLATHMPVIVRPEDYDFWLTPGQKTYESLFASYPAAEIDVWPAAAEVGNVRLNYPELVNRPGENLL